MVGKEKLILFVDLDYHPNVSGLISTAEQEGRVKEKKEGICLEENTFLSILNWKWESFASALSVEGKLQAYTVVVKGYKNVKLMIVKWNKTLMLNNLDHYDLKIK